ncbi:uncharacterized protein LOC134531351 [Bacillus rossius redtenbacheri]|uniref:uncharacterized protein LOC134531351 n=1 Tax=Bacillus rossius redtenbacheri TaxID=93214 RepID=UPI002FDD01CC
MNDYRVLTSEIKVPKEWPVEGIQNLIEFLAQDGICCHQSGKKFVMTVGNVSAMITTNGTRPGYVFKKIEQIDDENTYRTDLIVPAKIVILKRKPGGPDDKEEESTQCLPMNLKFDHLITKLLVKRPDRHTVVTVVPDLQRILLLKGITGLKMYDYSFRTTYRVHNIKRLDDIVSDMKLADSSIAAELVSENRWDIVCYDRLPRPQYVQALSVTWCLRSDLGWNPGPTLVSVSRTIPTSAGKCWAGRLRWAPALGVHWESGQARRHARPASAASGADRSTRGRRLCKSRWRRAPPPAHASPPVDHAYVGCTGRCEAA